MDTVSTITPTELHAVRFLDDETREEIDGAYVGCLVQIGHDQPRLTSELTPEQRDILLTHLARDPHSVWDEIRRAILVHIQDWTDAEVQDRLGLEPGDVPIMRGTSRFLTVSDAITIAEHAGTDLPGLLRAAQRGNTRYPVLGRPEERTIRRLSRVTEEHLGRDE